MQDFLPKKIFLYKINKRDFKINSKLQIISYKI